jgi:hypothetical protein
VGESVDVGGWRLTVMRRDRHRVAELRLARSGPATGDGRSDVPGDREEAARG